MRGKYLVEKASECELERMPAIIIYYDWGNIGHIQKVNLPKDFNYARLVKSYKEKHKDMEAEVELVVFNKKRINELTYLLDLIADEVF